MRPPASPSCRLYEPEAVGAIGAYAPEGIWNDGIAALRLFILLKTIPTFLTIYNHPNIQIISIRVRSLNAGVILTFFS
jgi:hypothetical protein